MDDLLARLLWRLDEPLRRQRVEQLAHALDLLLRDEAAAEALLDDRRDLEIRRAARPEPGRVVVALDRRRERVAERGERGLLDLGQDD